MTALRKVLSGEGRSFAPFAWDALPAMVNVTVADGWWADPVLCRRLLLDLAGATQAQAVVVGILHPSEWKALEENPGFDELVDDPLGDQTISSAITKLRDLAAMMPVGVIAALPELTQGGSDLSDDILCDIARGAMAAGIEAILISGVGGASAIVGRLTRLSDNFDLPVIVLDGEGTAREVTRNGQVSASGVATGVVLTPGDVSRTWTLAQLREFGALR